MIEFKYGGAGSSVIANTFVSVNSGHNFSPANYSLRQNYPNPFNPNTIISYQLGVSSFVSLKVYDILGNEVGVLINGNQNAGSYEIEFDGSTLSSGIYFYTLKTGFDFTDTKQMILLK